MITIFFGKGSHFSVVLAGLLLALLLPLSSAVAKHAPLEPLNDRNVITVGSELDYPPYAMVDGNGNADGFSVDLIKAVAREMGLKLKFVVGPWSVVKSKLERGEIDALPLVAYAKERDRYFDFSHPHIISHAVIFVRKKREELQTPEDFRGKEVIVMRGDSTHEYITSSHLTDKITLTASVGEALKLLSSGKHDFVVAPKLAGLLLLDELNIKNLEPFGEPLETYGKGYAFAVHEGDHELLEYLDRGLLLVRESGEYARIYDKWFGHVDPKIPGYEAILKYLYIAGAILLTLILTSFLWNFMLRRQVSQKTSALKESEERFRLLVNNAGDGVFLNDMDGNFVDVNDMACATLGYRREELLKMRVSDIQTEVPPDHLKHLWKEIKTATSTTLEATHKRKDESTFPVEIRLTKVGHENEYHIIAVARDITERKLTEVQLIKDEQRFRALFESAGDYALVLKIQDHGPPIIVDANQAAFIKHGYSRNEMIGRPITLLDPTASFETTRSRTAKILEGKVAHFEGEHVCKDGTSFVAEASAQLLQNREDKVFFSIERDISERKAAQEKIEKLSQAVVQSGEAIVIADAKGTIEYVNPAFTTLTGYSEEEAIGQNPSMLKSGNQSAQFYEEMWGILTSGEVWQGKVVNKKKGGKFYPAILTVSPIKNEKGTITHYIGLQQSLEEYEELEAKFHQAQKMEALGTLVGGIAHDFNNLLAGITGNTYLLKKEAAGLPGCMSKLSTIDELSYRAAGLIRQLLTFARKDRVDIKSLPLNIFIKEFLKLIRASIPENIQIHHDIESAPMLIKGDATQLNQVLMNLVNNAVHAVEEVRDPLINISLKLQRSAPEHPGWMKGTYAHLIVEDNGCGISAEHQQHLFEPFFTTKPQGKGTGLGLAMVFGAIETHHGHIEVKSETGKGASFHIYLPLSGEKHTGERDTEERPAKYPPVMGEGETILLVDDEANALSTLEEVLKSLNYHIIKATNGLDAIKTFDTHHSAISLIIMDVIMPKMGGVEAFEQISKEYPEAKVIFLTGYDKGAIPKSNIDINDSQIISKPNDVSSLSKVIREALNS